MAQNSPPVSARRVETVKPTAEMQILSDGKGLSLHVGPARYDADGKQQPPSKWWRLRYRFNGKPRMLSLGTYPDVSLDLARRRRAEARELLADGVDPSENRKAQKKASSQRTNVPTIESVAREWITVASSDWAEGHARMIRSHMERYVIALLGSKPIAEVHHQGYNGRAACDRSRRLSGNRASSSFHHRPDFSFRTGFGCGRRNWQPCSLAWSGTEEPSETPHVGNTRHARAWPTPACVGHLPRIGRPLCAAASPNAIRSPRRTAENAMGSY